jgi:hypothetical protein
MVTQRSFEELNLWQRIFAEHWERFTKARCTRRSRRPSSSDSDMEQDSGPGLRVDARRAVVGAGD